MRGPSFRLGAATAALLLAWSFHLSAVAEDRVSFRTVYFREASTRVIQPMLEATADLPRNFDALVRLGVDDISSASIGAGANADTVFHEQRREGTVAIGHTWDTLRVAGTFRYSHEPDYISKTGALTISDELWARTATLVLSLAYTHDDVLPAPPLLPKKLDVYYAGLAYTQVLSPTTIAQLVYDLYYQDGYFANPYLSHPDLGREDIPPWRLRHAVAFRIAQYFPKATFGVQLHYRFYFDQKSPGTTGPWGLTAHTVEGRIYKDLGRDVELRFSYRYHWQGSANFWCNAQPANGGDLGCYGMTPEWHAWDVKFGHLTTHLPELRLTWELRAFERIPFLRFFAPGAAEISYGYYFESTPYGQKFTDTTAPPVLGAIPLTRDHGGAHLLQTGYSLPF